MPLRVGVSRRVELGDGLDATETRRLLAAAARATLRDRGLSAAEVSLTLLDDGAITHLNREWLGHERPTDVIAFALHGEGEAPLGDVYLGVEQARRQAEEHGVPLAEELVRLTVHGILHVLGYDHPADESREGSEMWAVQERIVREVLA